MFRVFTSLSKKPIRILYIDSCGALLAGILTILLNSLLTKFYNWNENFTLFVGYINIAYGFYSGILSLRVFNGVLPEKKWIIFLVIANCVWAGQCFTQFYYQLDHASFFGLIHLLFEASYVIGLAYFESKYLLS